MSRFERLLTVLFAPIYGLAIIVALPRTIASQMASGHEQAAFPWGLVALDALALAMLIVAVVLASRDPKVRGWL